MEMVQVQVEWARGLAGDLVTVAGTTIRVVWQALVLEEVWDADLEEIWVLAPDMDLMVVMVSLSLMITALIRKKSI